MSDEVIATIKLPCPMDVFAKLCKIIPKMKPNNVVYIRHNEELGIEEFVISHEET